MGTGCLCLGREGSELCRNELGRDGSNELGDSIVWQRFRSLASSAARR